MSWAEDMWISYPHPASKGVRTKSIAKLNKVAKKSRPLFEERLEQYKQYIEITSWYHAKMMYTYLNSDWQEPINLDQARNEASKDEKTIKLSAADRGRQKSREWLAEQNRPENPLRVVGGDD